MRLLLLQALQGTCIARDSLQRSRQSVRHLRAQAGHQGSPIHDRAESASRSSCRESGWPDGLKLIGTTRLKGERLKQFRVDVQIHRNQPGTMELGEGAHSLQMDEGVSLAPRARRGSRCWDYAPWFEAASS